MSHHDPRFENCKYWKRLGPYEYRCARGWDPDACDCPDDVPEPVDHFSMRRGHQRARDAGVD